MNFLLHTEGIIFDLDGVIADSRRMLREAWQKWCSLYGISIDDVRKVAHGRRAVDTIKILTPHLNPVDELKKLEAFETEFIEMIIPINGVLNFIDKIGNIPWGVCTSGSRKSTKLKLDKILGFVPYNSICSEDVNNGKPEPEPYLALCSKLRIEPEKVIVFEDSPSGIKSSINAGCKTIGITTASKPEIMQDADYLINDFSNLRVISTADRKLTFSIEGESKSFK